MMEEGEYRFEKDDYIVITGAGISSNSLERFTSDSFKEGFVFKQRYRDKQLMPRIDCKGSRNNGWSCYRASQEGLNWRHAYDAEIAAYDKAGKPVDVGMVTIDNYSII